jgi:hypothetical protein
MLVFAALGAVAAVIGIFLAPVSILDGRIVVQPQLPCKSMRQGTTLRLCTGDPWPPPGATFQLELAAILKDGPVPRALLHVRDGATDGRPRAYTKGEEVSLSTRSGNRALRIRAISDRPEFVEIDVSSLPN